MPGGEAEGAASLWATALRCAAGALLAAVLAPRAAQLVAEAAMHFAPTRRWVQGRARRRMLRRLAKVGVACPDAAAAAGAGGAPDCADPACEYPDYYLREYHAYPEGNLCWEAAVEAEAMSISAAMVAYPEKGRDACRHMHDVALSALPREVRDGAARVLDAGCGVGQSTFPVARALPNARVTAVDLSPYFLHMAKAAAAGDDAGGRIDWRHCALEALPAEWAGQYDVATLIGVTHELPAAVTRRCLRELHRVLRPGGTLLAVDVDPTAVRRMPRFVYAMFRSTEPDMDEYLGIDVREEVVRAGFESAACGGAAPGLRRRVVIVATKPA